MKDGFHEVSKKRLAALAKGALKAAFTDKQAGGYLILLSGNLGSGKTTFVQTFGQHLGIKEKILSPTFVFVHEHTIRELRIKNQESREPIFKKLIHVDAYRMETKRDVETAGILKYLEDPKNIVVIEWGEKIKQWLPKPDLVIEFKHYSPHLRKVRVVRI